MMEDDVFKQLFEQVNPLLEANNLEKKINQPRQRRPPDSARLTDSAEAFVAVSAMDHYKAIFFSILDITTMQLQHKFHQASMERCGELEVAPLTHGCVILAEITLSNCRPCHLSCYL